MKILKNYMLVIVLALISLLSFKVKGQSCKLEIGESNKKALIILERSILEMTGGQAVNIQSLEVSITSKKFMEGQSLNFSKPLDSLPSSQYFYVDMKRDRILSERVDRYLGGYEFSFRTIFTDSIGFNYEYPKLRFSQLNMLPMANKIPFKNQLLRTLPLFLLQAARDNPASLRFAGEEKFNEHNCYHLTGSIPGSGLLDFYIDKDSFLLTGTAQISQNIVRGDQTLYTCFVDYQIVAGMYFPKHMKAYTNFESLHEDSLVVQINSVKAQEEIFHLPEGYSEIGPAGKGFTPLGNGIFMLENIGGYNVLCLEYSNYIVILEAVQGSEEVISLVRKRFPGKEIRYVAISHHHEDHAGGLRAFIAKDITVIAGSKSTGFVNYIANSSHLLFPDIQQQLTKKPRLLTIKNIYSLKDDGPEMMMIDFGPNAHAEEIFVYYFPKERIIFQADLLISNDQGKVIKPLIPVNIQFYHKLKFMKLKVSKIYGVHLNAVDFKDFEAAALQQAKP